MSRTATDLTDAQITVGGALEWVVVRKAAPRNRVQFWTARHHVCGVEVDLPLTMLQAALKGKGTVPPCASCTPADVRPAISHGLHLACGVAHVVGEPCGFAGPGECKHGTAWEDCGACTALAGVPVRPVVTVTREGGATVIRSQRTLDLEPYAAQDEIGGGPIGRLLRRGDWELDPDSTAPRELDLDAFADDDGPDSSAAWAAAVEFVATGHMPPAEAPRELDLAGGYESNEPEILRNGRGQPMIVPPDGGKPVPYTRASTFAGTLDDAGGLATWRVRLAGLGIARNPDLAMMAAALKYGDRELDAILETAHDRAGGNEKAHWGTAVHSYADQLGEIDVPAPMRSDVQAYADALAEHGITVESLGRFIVNDRYRVAGTYDQILRLSDGRRVMADIKTGTLHPLACAIQLAIYAGGEHYGLDGHGNYYVRKPLEVDQELAIIAHIPKGAARRYGTARAAARSPTPPNSSAPPAAGKSPRSRSPPSP